MTQDAPEKSPNEILAEQLVHHLIDANLIPSDHSSELERKLKVGGVTEEDWNLWVDIATAPEKLETGSDE